MHVCLPTIATPLWLEWCVVEGDAVTLDQPLAWLSVPDHCALVPLASPQAGVVTARWTPLLTKGPAGAVVAEIDGAGVECRRAEHQALRAEGAEVEARLRELRQRAESPMAAALLQQEIDRHERWLTEVAALFEHEAHLTSAT
ncbi:MAG: hypothetical protein Q8L14_07015 [Myxococcales bacterium]|nr:hypothetical protein [Myxococcales bacterium]